MLLLTLKNARFCKKKTARYVLDPPVPDLDPEPEPETELELETEPETFPKSESEPK
jgi:hypothetical protein